MRNSFRLDPDGNLRSELLEQIPGLAHGFGTRSAGWPSGALATVKQIHSAVVVDAGGTGGLKGEGDAIISASPGIAVAVKTADCVPILLVDAKRQVACAVHAGWRGTVQEIVVRALERMVEIHQTNPEDVYAAIGPAIGVCCYEVGSEVAGQFARWDARLAVATERQHLDLRDLNRRQLLAAGVAESRVACADLCTKCEPGLFFSYRRDPGETGRMVSWTEFQLQGTQ